MLGSFFLRVPGSANAQIRKYFVKHPEKKYAKAALALLSSGGYTHLNSGYSVICIDNPVVLMLDAQSMFKQSYRDRAEVRRAIAHSRRALMQQIVKRHRGKLILTFDRNMLYHGIDREIEKLNSPNDSGLGDKICVPFGDIYRRWLLPHSVTKALHIERVYDPSLDYFTIEPKPSYQELSTQIQIIGAFKKSVILIDDLLDSSLRLREIEPHFKSNSVRAKDIVVGVLTAKGERRAKRKGYNVHSAYTLPSISTWYSESHLYPFIGGDAHGSTYGETTWMASVNKMLPYMSDPSNCVGLSDYIAFSKSCIEASLHIFDVIERIYEQSTKRHLSLSHLGDVFITPRAPYYGSGVQICASATPSEMLTNDIQRLEQIAKIV